MDTTLHVQCTLGIGIPHSAKGPMLLAMERAARQATGLRIEVFLETMGDDSKLRVMMTEEERARL